MAARRVDAAERRSGEQEVPVEYHLDALPEDVCAWTERRGVRLFFSFGFSFLLYKAAWMPLSLGDTRKSHN